MRRATQSRTALAATIGIYAAGSPAWLSPVVRRWRRLTPALRHADQAVPRTSRAAWREAYSSRENSRHTELRTLSQAAQRGQVGEGHLGAVLEVPLVLVGAAPGDLLVVEDRDHLVVQDQAADVPVAGADDRHLRVQGDGLGVQETGLVLEDAHPGVQGRREVGVGRVERQLLVRQAGHHQPHVHAARRRDAHRRRATARPGTKYGDWIQARSRAVVSATTKTSRMVGKGVDTLEWRTCTGIPSPRSPGPARR